MKFRNIGRTLLASVVSVGLLSGLVSCTGSFTRGFLYVTGTVTGESSGIVTGFKIDNNTGKLTSIDGSPFSSGGTRPLKEVMNSSGTYMYVLNGGDETTGDGSGIEQFSVGGNGIIYAQKHFDAQGTFPWRLAFDSTGSYLYVLSKYAPNSTTQGCITVFSIDSTTGRLSLVTNQQSLASDGTQLTYFPVPANPTDMVVLSGYVYVSSGNDQSIYTYAVGTSGQLTVTSSGSQATSATKISAIRVGGTKLYVLDAGKSPSQIIPYTVGTNGALQVNTGGAADNDSAVSNPTDLILEALNSRSIFVANAGATTDADTDNPQSAITGFDIDSSTGQLTEKGGSPFSSGSGPQCIIEDPSDRYVYAANYNDSTVSARVLDRRSGVLNPLRAAQAYDASGQMTGGCVVTGRTNR